LEQVKPVRFKGVLAGRSEPPKTKRGICSYIFGTVVTGLARFPQRMPHILCRVTATVLVIDDDPVNRELMLELLEAEGIPATAAADGRMGLLEFARVRPDLVLLDVQMPGVDGFDVCRRLKANPETRLTPIVLVTALSATQDRILGLQAGADDFLSKPVDRSELLARVRSLLSLKSFTDELERAEAVLFALARSIEAKDPYTQGHCERLAMYGVALAKRLGLPEDHIVAMRRGGVVHDIGKVAVPESILLKPDRLTPEEFSIVKQHPVVGERICSPLRAMRLVLPIIRHHHEKLDGSGYPDGLRGDRIPLTARILQVVDVYDALTTARPYKPALSPENALDIMEDEVRRGWWQADLVAEFSRIICHEKPQSTALGASVEHSYL
jgi:putative two-component system response regulator